MAHPAPPPPDWLREKSRQLYGTDADGYDAGRPEYPDRVYEVLRARCRLREGAAVLEIGPGTGIATRQLLAAGAHVVAAEPDPALAARLAELHAGAALEVIAEPFEDAVVADASFDLVAAAMSFHWVEQEIGFAKLGRVLRPGGWAALWWTVYGDPERPDAFHQAFIEEIGGSDKLPKPLYELAVEERCAELRDRAGLVDVEAELIRWTPRFDTAGIRALYASMIHVRRRPPEEQQWILDAVSKIADDLGGVVERPFITSVYTGRRPAAVPPLA